MPASRDLDWSQERWEDLHNYASQQLKATQHLWSELRLSSQMRAPARDLSHLADTWVAVMDASEKRDSTRASYYLLQAQQQASLASETFCSQTE